MNSFGTFQKKNQYTLRTALCLVNTKSISVQRSEAMRKYSRHLTTQSRRTCVMDREDSLWSSQKPSIVFHPEPIEPIQRLQSRYLQAAFITVRPTIPSHQQQPLSMKNSG
jgi:hypothetical protein